MHPGFPIVKPFDLRMTSKVVLGVSQTSQSLLNSA